MSGMLKEEREERMWGRTHPLGRFPSFMLLPVVFLFCGLVAIWARGRIEEMEKFHP